jgi:large subunit ribosomal protein L32e
MRIKFLRRVWKKYSKLGRRNKKNQKWRRPTGRDNKMRERRKGYPARVSVGYQKDRLLQGKIREKEPIVIRNIQDLEKVKKNEIAVLGSIGKKKKIEIIKKAEEKKIEIHNINTKKFLKELKKPEIKKENKTMEKKK